MLRGGYTCGRDTDLSEDVHPNFVAMGNNVKIRAGTILFGSQGRPIEIGDDVVIGAHCYLQGTSAKLRIGSRVALAVGVAIHTDSGPNHSEILQKQFPIIAADVTIEDDVWIGSYAVILPGVTIGKGSIIGAHSVIKKDIPPGSLVDPQPVRVVPLPQ